MVSQRDLFNACLHTFIERYYEASLELAQYLGKQDSFLPFPIWMVLLLSARHIGHTSLINNIGDQVLHASKSKPWEHALICLVLGKRDPADVLAQAKSDEERCQAYYYLGAHQLVEKDTAAALRSFMSCIECPTECLEHSVAEQVVERFDRLNDREYADGDLMNDGRFRGAVAPTVWELEELLEKLAGEHRFGFLYRGQRKDYGTLLPSGYRLVANMSRVPFVRSDGQSLRNRGRVFRPLLPNSLWPADQSRRIDFVSLCRSNLGYPLSQLFCQHCCLPAEGLDVTEDLNIAAMFAIFNYDSNSFERSTDEPGVIYRFSVPITAPLTLEQLKRIDFYSCPFFLSGVTILDLLTKCSTLSESKSSFGAYYLRKNELEMTLENFDDIRTSRPLEMIRLPHHEVKIGRVMMQRAGLVFPDSLLPQSFDASSAPPPPGKTWDGPHCVEDLAKSDAVETFLFRHDEGNPANLAVDPSSVFPKEDPLRTLLSGAVTAMSGGLGANVIAPMDKSVFTSGEDEEMPR